MKSRAVARGDALRAVIWRTSAAAPSLFSAQGAHVETLDPRKTP